MTIQDLSHLCNTLTAAAVHWEKVGLNLDIPISELDKIRVHPQYSVKGVDEYFLRMLMKWLESSPERTVKNLKSALEQVGLNALASNIFQLLNSSRCTNYVGYNKVWLLHTLFRKM